MRHSLRTIGAATAAALLVAPAGIGAQQIVFPRPAAAQQADHDGRTLLPMRVARSIAFRSIGPAVSGGRVSAVAGVAGQNDTFTWARLTVACSAPRMAASPGLPSSSTSTRCRSARWRWIR
ncbi:MAG: hypothetical protein ACRENQ_11730 [Gemmatimonadaceae bacterium]